MDQYQYNKWISNIICDDLNKLFDVLNIQMEDCGRYLKSRCYIHDGDNPGAINLYPHGLNIRGYYKCNTHQCEQVFGKTILGFIRGVLSHNQLNWQDKSHTNRMIDIKYVKDFVHDLYKVPKDLSKLTKLAEINREIRIFDNMANLLFTPPQIVNSKQITRSMIRQRLNIPAEYYLKRGYSKEILDKYDIGLCQKPGTEMYRRIVIPIYDENYQYMVCCVGRCLYEVCPKCKHCHHPGFECDIVDFKYVKWKNQKGHECRNHLFNYWFAKPYIQRLKTVFIVESPGNVLRLEEAGIKNSIALFGTSMTEQQKITLETSGAMNAIIIMDNDINSAGEIATDILTDKLKYIMNIKVYKPDKNDIGDMTVDEVKQKILPLVKDNYANGN